MKLMACIAFLLSLMLVGSVSTTGAQQVYKKTNPDGSISFTTAPTEPGFAPDGPAHVGRSHHGDPTAESSWSNSEAGAHSEDRMYEYDQAGRLSASTRGGRTTTHEYDSRNNLVRSTGPDSETINEYDADNQILSHTVRSVK